MHVKNSKNILTLIIGGRLKSENSFEHFSLIIIKGYLVYIFKL